MISQLRLTNFKCFKELCLPLSMFTLLSGLNGMGKSSVIQSILLLRQSWRSGDFKMGRLALNGELTTLGTGHDVLFEGADFDHVGIGLETSSATLPSASIDLLYSYDRSANRLLSMLPDPDIHREIHGIIASSGMETGLAFVRDKKNCNALINKLIKENLSPSEMSAKLIRDGIKQLWEQKQWMELTERRSTPPFGGQFHYVFAERYGPRKMLPLSETHVREKNMGLHGEYVLHFLLEYGKKITLPDTDPRLTNPEEFGYSLIGQVNAWLQEISPGSHLAIEEIRRADSVISGFTFDRPGDVQTRPFRATNVGFGLSYVLPVITTLLSAEPDALILLENPEAHMHPRGQTRLGQLTARTAAAGIQVILETHSDHVMDGARIDIRTGGAGRLAARDATFHYFGRNGATAYVTSPSISDDGRLNTWPGGFFDQHDENLIALLAPKSRH